MPDKIRTLQQLPDNTFIDEEGKAHTPPLNWIFLPAGDAGVTRKVTASGVYWRIQKKKGRKVFSLGVWAPSEKIENAIRLTEQQRNDTGYQKKLDQLRQQRAKKQKIYEDDFLEAVKKYLNFHNRYSDIEHKIAVMVTVHATPVGSGTVARTATIPLEQRAAKAVIAWLRHNTTAYDDMKIARKKGARREVRRELAAISTTILNKYRAGEEIDDNCPIYKSTLAIDSNY